MNADISQRILRQTKEVYNRIAADFSRTRSKWWWDPGDFKRYFRPGDRVLDLGCGNGRLAEIFSAPVNYLGIDNSQKLIKIAKARFKNRPDLKFKLGDLVDLKLGNERFDLVLLIAVLHHIPTKKLRLKILRDIHRLLNPGGRLVISTWNLWRGDYFKKYFLSAYNWRQKIRCRSWSLRDFLVPWKASGEPHWRYVHVFTQGELKSLLIKAGFKIEKIGYETVDGKMASVLKGHNLVAVANK